MKLSIKQFDILSDFFNDVAKGLLLGVVVNYLTGVAYSKLFISLGGVFFAILLLGLALLFSKEQIYDYRKY